MRLCMLIFSTIMLVLGVPQIPRINTENVGDIQVINSISFGENVVWDIAFQPATNTVAIILERNDSLFLLNVRTLEENIEISQLLTATAIEFSSDGRLFATGNWEGEISIYTTDDYRLVESHPAIGHVVNDLAFSPDGSLLGATFGNPMLAGEGEDAFQLISVQTGELLFSYPFENGVYGGGVDFDNTGEWVYFSTTDASTRTESGMVHKLNTSTMQLTTMEYEIRPFSDDLIFSRGLIYIGDDRVFVERPLTETDGGTFQVGFEQEQEAITSISHHPNEPILAVGYSTRISRPDGGPSTTNDGVIRLYDTETGEELVSLDSPEGAIWSLAFSPDGTLLASGGTDGTVRLWGIPADDD